ncbi:MAG: hypothetical protein H6734_07220 [Alphaproteobacteria bacterium]|nr:hypothetical protein [Alphaproteobacteria bacterium]
MIVLSLSAFAAAPDLALATDVSGEVVLKGATPAPLVAFSKVREGDVLVLPGDSRVQLTWFEDGHSDTYAGPLELVVGGSTAPVARQAGDALVGQALADLPALLQRAEMDKGGHTLVRGEAVAAVPLDEDELAELAEAQKRYDALRAGAPEADVVPELYLASVQLALGQRDAARKTLDGATARCAACPAPRRLLDALGHTTPAAGAPVTGPG